jgi:hypothetical protein
MVVHLMHLSLQMSLQCCSMGTPCTGYLHLRLSLCSFGPLSMRCLLLHHHGGPRNQQARWKCHFSGFTTNKTGNIQPIPKYKYTSVTLMTSEMAPHFFFKYSKIPLIWINWEDEPSGYAENPHNWISLWKYATLAI